MKAAAKEFEPREHSIRAELAHLKEARDFADDAAAAFGFNNEGRYQVKLAMSEAVTNAIEHGSSAPDDPIGLAAVEERGALAFYVADTGRFVPRMAPKGELPERGRGLEFMRLVMEEVDVRPGPGGTVLRFTKRMA
jgi:anti-sigma regulatory factor (Ser/Thr protein kinase)